MRYLAGLARETTATVRPPRAPSWLDAALPLTAPTAEESVAPHDLDRGAAPPDTARNRGGVREGTADPNDGRDRTARSGAAPLRGSAEARAAHAAEPAFAPQPRATGRRVSPGMAAASNPPPALAGEAGLTGGPLREARGREARGSDPTVTPEAVAIPDRAASAPLAGFGSGASLQSVVSELARRQQRLDAQRAATAARAPLPPRESSNPRSLSPRAAEETRLDIGSIVVQVLPEPPAAPAARSAKPRQEHASQRRWARSFLDRST